MFPFMFGDILKTYGQMFKMGFLAALILGVISYGGYLRYKVWSYEQQFKELKAIADNCDEQKARLKSALETQLKIMDSLNSYYKDRKPLDIKDGELKPDEILAPQPRKTHGK